MNVKRLGRVLRSSLCALAPALALAMPAQAAIIASYENNMGISFSNFGEPQVDAPFAEMAVFGTNVLGPSPVASGDSFVVDLGGAELAAAIAMFTDGVDSGTFWITLKHGLDSVNDAFWISVTLSESPASIGDLQGNTIAGIRIVWDNFCVDPSYQGNPCGFTDPNGNVVGISSHFRIQVSDTPFGVPEPGVLGLLGLGALALTSARRAGRLASRPRR